jgi:hypothetical protein
VHLHELTLLQRRHYEAGCIRNGREP